ncbi:TNF receptor-associated factor 6-like isoform X2 [Clytia hemisphaerica]|uniref:RING-type domain-containing protein n=1 Tax=Clytia hemisphaerica TaxID=252671 RepID=A0A7M5UBL1_9CNID
MAASRDHGNNNMNGYSSSSSEEDVNIGYHFELVENDFQCIICHYVIRGFTELPCGHAGCKFCIEEWEKRKVACCQCQKTYDKTKKNSSLYIDRTIKHQRMALCKQHEQGCTWQGSIADYKDQHRKECAFRNVRCRLCNQKVARQEKEGHKLTCTHRLVNCTTCGGQYSFINKKKHEDEECKVQCDYWQYGCHEKVYKPHMERHLANSARRHIELVKTHYDRIVTELNTTVSLQSEHITDLTTQLERTKLPMATSSSSPTVKQTVEPKTLPRPPIRIYEKKEDKQQQQATNPFRPVSAKWDGQKMYNIVFQGKTLTFDDVYKILDEKKFAKFEEIFQQNPNIVNSLRDGYGFTLLMEAVCKDRFDVFVHLMKYPQDFSLVGNNGWNVLHWVGRYGTVRHLEKFDQQTIKMLIDGRDKWNKTPLHFAACWNKHDVIRWLLAKGANPELKDEDGQRPDEQLMSGCDGVTKEIFRSFRSS